MQCPTACAKITTKTASSMNVNKGARTVRALKGKVGFCTGVRRDVYRNRATGNKARRRVFPEADPEQAGGVGAPLYRGGDFAGVCQGLHHPLGGKDKAEGETNGGQEHSDGQELALH